MSGPGVAAALTDDELEHLVAVLREMRQPWWWRARRRLAFFLAFRLRLIRLGYLVDVERDRFEDE